MPRASPIQTDFSTGEISPTVLGRVDADRYKTALAKCENFFPTAQGALVRRSGTRFVSEVANSINFTRLVPFEFSVDQSYILEFGNEVMRVYANYGIVEVSPGVPFELAVPWDSSEIVDISWVQSGDVLYVTHPDWRVRKIVRYDDDDWRLEIADLSDGPYDDVESPGYSLVTSGLTSIGDKFRVTFLAGPELTVLHNVDLGGGISEFETTASHGLAADMRIVFKNGGTLFGPYKIISITTAAKFTVEYPTLVADDAAGYKIRPAPFFNLNSALGYSAEAGRKFRVLVGSTWIPGTILASSAPGTYAGTAEVTADMDATIANSTSISSWRRGAFYSDTALGVSPANVPVPAPGFASAIAFHEDRLFLGSSTGQRVFSSKSSDYENFAPTDLDGTVNADSAITFALNQGGFDKITWFSSDEQGLLIGTSGAEFWARGSTQYEAMSPTNINVKKSTSYGSSDVNPVQAGKGTMFLQRSGRKIRELAYFYDVNGYRATDMSILADHITLGGVTELAFQKEPHPIIWAIRSDGALLGLSYDRDLDNLRAGWHRHILGGSGYPGNGAPVVESIAVIPSPDGTRYDLWMVVQRQIDGNVVRYVEYMEKIFDDSVDYLDGFYVDSGLTYSEILEEVAIGKANPCPAVKVAHGLSTGDKVRLRNVGGFEGIEYVTSLVTVVDADNFTLDSLDTSAQEPISGSADMYVMNNTVSGLTHLEGETVSVCGDGAFYSEQVVTAGAVNLAQECAVIHVGLPYVSDAKMLRLDAGSADGTSIGKFRKIPQASFMLHRSAQFKLGMSFNSMNEVNFRNQDDPLNEAPPLFTGIYENHRFGGSPDVNNQICIRQDKPLPLAVLAVMPQILTADK